MGSDVECRCQLDPETGVVTVICAMHVQKVGREMLDRLRRDAEDPPEVSQT